MVPLAADLAATQRSAAAEAERPRTTIRPRPAQARRSWPARCCSTGCALLGVPWGPAVEAGRTTGTFKEAWDLRLGARARGRPDRGQPLRHHRARRRRRTGCARRRRGGHPRPSSAALVETCLLAELPDGAARGRRRRWPSAPPTSTTSAPCSTPSSRWPGPAGTATCVARHRGRRPRARRRSWSGRGSACALPAPGLDDDAAQRHATAVEAAQRGDRAAGRPRAGPSLAPGAGQARRRRAPCTARSRDGSTGCCSTPASVDSEVAARRLSPAAVGRRPRRAAAAWLDGFLGGDAVLLLHDAELLRLVDEWVAASTTAVFEDLLPLLRRTFARVQPAERRRLGTHRRRGVGAASTATAAPVDDDRALPASLAAVADCSGWRWRRDRRRRDRPRRRTRPRCPDGRRAATG